MDVAKTIVDYRARHNLSQQAFAELVGMTVNGIYKLESGKRKARATTVSKIQQLIDKE